MLNLSTFDAFKHIKDSADTIVIEGELLQRLQDELLVILGDVIDVCDANGIAYTLSGGTCLGAVRHGGFIPWDDDVDVNIMRADVDTFVEKFREAHGEEYWIHHPLETHDYGIGLIQLRKKGTVMRIRDDFGTEECGVPIDVFIVENAPDNALLRFAHGFGSLALGFALSCRRFARYGDRYMELVGHDSQLRKTFGVKIALGRLVSFASLDTWCRAWYRWNALCENGSSEYVTIPAGRAHYFGELQLRSAFIPTRSAKFQGIAAQVPNDCDAYLSSLYGKDYIVPPPEGDRETHVVYELGFGDGRSVGRLVEMGGF